MRNITIQFLRFSLLVLLTSTWSFAQTSPGCTGASDYLWLKADAGTSTTTEGAKVHQWSDQSGNANDATQSTNNRKPNYESSVLNYNPGLYFSGDFMQGNAGYSSGTQIVVFKTATGISKSSNAKTLISSSYSESTSFCRDLPSKLSFIPIKQSSSGYFPVAGKTADQVTISSSNPISSGYLFIDLVFNSVPNNLSNTKVKLSFNDLDLHKQYFFSNQVSLVEGFELYDVNENLLATLDESHSDTGTFDWEFDIDSSLVINNSITFKIKLTAEVELLSGGTRTVSNTIDEIPSLSFCGEQTDVLTSSFKVGKFNSVLSNEYYGVHKGNTNDGFASAVVGNDSFSRSILVSQSNSSTNEWGFIRNGSTENVSSGGNGVYSDWTDRPYSVGALATSTGSSQRFNGHILEVLSYPTKLSASDLQKANSYLAIKYGITLGQNYVDGDGDLLYDVSSYGTRVFGIGRVDCQGLHQRQSKSESEGSENLLTIGYNKIIGSTNSSTNGNDVPNEAFVVLGDNNDDRSAWTVTNAPVTSLSESKRIARGWKATTTGSPSESIRISLDGTKLPGTIELGERVAMVISTTEAGLVDADFTDTDKLIVPMTASGDNWIVDYNFNGTGTRYITFIKYSDCYKDLICEGSTTWNGAAWSDGIPDETKNAIIDGDFSTSSNNNFSCCTLVVNSGKTLSIHNGGLVEVQSDVTNSGTLTIANNGSLLQYYDNAVNTGDITIARESNPMYKFDYTYWSSPVQGFDLSEIPHDRAYYWKEQTGAWGWASGEMGVGRGYILMTLNQSKTTPESIQTSFSGPMNNGRIYQDVNVAKSEWSLVGNPYPSALNAADFLSDPENINIEGTIYFWTHQTRISEIEHNRGDFTENDYATWNLTGGVGGVAAYEEGVVPNGKIATGQAFFVEAIGSGKIKFTNCMRSEGASDNSMFFRPSSDTQSNESSDAEGHKIWLGVTNLGGSYKQMLVGYVRGASNGLDRLYDGEIKNGENVVSLYSIVNEGESKQLTIQGRALPFNEADVVQLGFSVLEGASSTNTINIYNTEGLLKNQKAYLVDKYTNITHDLTEGGYTFESEVGEFDDRFELVYQNRTLSTESIQSNETELLVATGNGIITIQSNEIELSNVLVYNSLGKVVYSQASINSNMLIIDNLISSKALYVVVSTLSNGEEITTKVLF